jgi:hypothetical protein
VETAQRTKSQLESRYVGERTPDNQLSVQLGRRHRRSASSCVALMARR